VTSDAPLVNTTTESMAGLIGEKQVKECLSWAQLRSFDRTERGHG